MAYKKITGNFTSSADNINLFYCAFINKTFNPEKCIVIQHGFGEHSGRYFNVVEKFQNSGYSLFILDMRGHGLSEGLRGYSPNFNSLVEDLYSFIVFVKKTYKTKKPVLISHSLGGLIGLSFGLVPDYANQIKAIVSNGASLSVHMTPLLYVKRIAGKLLTMLIPELRLDLGLDVKFISHDKNVVKAYIDDPLVHGFIKVKLAEEIINKGKWCIDHASEMKIPVLLTHGGSDGISNPEGTKMFYANCGSKDKTLIIYDDLYHEVYNETEKEKPLNDLEKWVEKHT
ncbi:MAG: lysophospholipase [Spirochaetia bacterium]|nr:lysophospholipase [Spirochaetia bacterium]